MEAGGAPSTVQQDPISPDAHLAYMQQLERRIKEAELEKILFELNKNKGSQDDASQTGTIQNERIPSFTAHPEVQAAKSRFPGINLVQLDCIYTGSFDPSNLSKLRRLGGPVEDTHANTISIEDKKLRSEPAKGKSKDFGYNSNVWREGFINYITAVLFFFHGSTTPALPLAMMGFYQRIESLGRVYKWQEAVLPLALEHHNVVMAKGQTNAEAWDLLETEVAYFCNEETRRSAAPQQSAPSARSSKRQRPTRSPSSPTRHAFSRTRAYPPETSTRRRLV
jgi:hypothetical protein